jgi:hypothetical protein
MKQYEDMQNKILELGITILSATYYIDGSWEIQISASPPYRIAHDGRDKTIVLEILKNGWTCIIADKTKSGRHLIPKLKEELKIV